MLLNDVPVATPIFGVTNVGLLVNATVEVPDSSVSAVARFADVGVARNAATPVPRPDTPVEIGRPVAFVNVPLEGVPNAPPFTTTAPAEPTFVARAVATLVPSPETPVLIGKPVAFVSVAEDGVPSAGDVNVGDVKVLFVSVCVPESVATTGVSNVIVFAGSLYVKPVP
jgi:hypothetical protein